MKITILTLFPEMFSGPFDYSIIKRAIDKKKVSINIVNIRDFATDKRKSVDDHPYGGGTGMILRVDVMAAALKNREGYKILLDPKGSRYTQKKARELSKMKSLVLVCGHYEGIDARIRSLVDIELSIGDYVLTGGEIPAMVIVDSVVRLIPGVLKKEEATRFESFSEGTLLEYPQYTKPQTYHGRDVPEILLSGDHKKIDAWRKTEAQRRTHLLRKRIGAAGRNGRTNDEAL